LAAADAGEVHEILSALPYGYDTLLSRTFSSESDKHDPDTGIVLSGGQWQRVALARALLRDQADLMIMDEPSSGLDAEAEYRLTERLRQHRAGRTSVLISHRLGTLRDADHIAVLADGRIVERGKHAALVAAGGAYAHLFELQARGYRTDQAGTDPAGAETGADRADAMAATA
jgi:ATP-binding cassette subfamily B protein